MKKLLILPLFLILGVTSCKKDVPPMVNDQQTLTLADKPGHDPLAVLFAKCDDWSISNFNLNGKDMTYDYSSFKLNFCPDNTVILHNDIFSIHGTWYYRWSDAGGNSMYLTFTFSLADKDIPNIRPGTLWSNLEGTWNIAKIRNNIARFEINRGGETRTMDIDRVLK